MSAVMQLNLSSRAGAIHRELPRTGLDRVQIDEPLVLLVGHYGSWADLGELSGQLGDAMCGQKTAVLRLGAVSGGAVDALMSLAEQVDRLVLVTSPDEIAAWPAGERERLAGWVQADAGKVLVESGIERAVVSAMQWLASGDSLALLCPAGQSLPHAKAALRSGAAWRASFQSMDDACF